MIMLNYMLMLMWPMVMHGVGEPQLYPELAETKILYLPNRNSRVSVRCVSSRECRVRRYAGEYAIVTMPF